MRPGQFACFLYDTRNDVMVNERGEPIESSDSVPVFDCVEDARGWVGEVLDRRPHLRADIFDSRGKAAGPVERVYSEPMRKRFDPDKRARRDCLVGGTLLLGAGGIAVLAALDDWRSIWAYVAGLKCLVLGTIFFVRGAAWRWDQRGR